MSDTVEVPVEVAATARTELGILIRQTGGDDGFELADGTVQPLTPLALLKVRVREADLVCEEEVIELIDDVGRETSMGTGLTDPLTDGTFRAHTELVSALGGSAEESEQ